MVNPEKASFQKKRGANSYELFGTLTGYNDSIPDNDNKWEVWFCDCAIKCSHLEVRVIVCNEDDIKSEDKA